MNRLKSLARTLFALGVILPLAFLLLSLTAIIRPHKARRILRESIARVNARRR